MFGSRIQRRLLIDLTYGDYRERWNTAHLDLNHA